MPGPLAAMLQPLFALAKLYPAAISALLLFSFGRSLFKGPPMAERLARLKHPDLSPAAVAYTRKVTIVWCVYFACNAAIALVTALWMSAGAWALYNGVISNIVLAALMGGELLVRRRVQRAHAKP
jgi:uncharacterized membrane protein